MERNREFRRLYRSFYPALIARDEAALRRILSDDFTITHSGSLQQNKEQFIHAVLDGTLQYFSEAENSISIDEFENILSGESRVEADLFRSGRMPRDVQVEMRMTHGPEGWQIGAAEEGPA